MSNSIKVEKLELISSDAEESIENALKKETEKRNKFQCEKIIDDIRFYIITSLCKKEELIIEITEKLFNLLVVYYDIKIHCYEEKKVPTLFGVEIRILYADGYAWTLSKKIATKIY